VEYESDEHIIETGALYGLFKSASTTTFECIVKFFIYENEEDSAIYEWDIESEDANPTKL